jgi:starch phosphorylase
VLDALSSDRFCPREPGSFRWLPETLLNRDEYFIVADFASYAAARRQIAEEYLQPALWARKAILNVARVSCFSSDRTVREYARDIWDLKPV